MLFFSPLYGLLPKLAGQAPLAARQAQENLEKRTTFTLKYGSARQPFDAETQLAGTAKLAPAEPGPES